MRARCLDRLLTPHTHICLAAYGWIQEEKASPRNYWVRIEGVTHNFSSEPEAREFYETITAPLVTVFQAVTNGSEEAKKAKLLCLAKRPQPVF